MYHKIFITGGTGFVGTNLHHFLLEKYPDTEIVAGNSAMCDLMNQEELNDFLSTTRPDCVVHLAATCGGIGANRANPGKFMNDNLTMGLNIINAAKDADSIKKMVSLGTICSYPKITPVPFIEEDLWNGYPEETNAPYGIAKKALTELLIAYESEYNFNSVNLYPTNMYGPYDNFDPTSSHVIPAIILKVFHAKLTQQNHITLWGTGSATRDFLYVEDCCRAIDLAIQHDVGSQPINVGTNYEVSIHDLVRAICEIMNYGGELVWDSNYPDGQPRRCVDSSKAQALLGYKPSTDLKIGLTQTIEWFMRTTHRGSK